MNAFHNEILQQIKQHSGKPTQHTFLNNYLGNSHPRYPISIPLLRKIAKEWMKSHDYLKHTEISSLLTSLAKGKSSTEKCMVGTLLDYTNPEQRKFRPEIFNTWLDELEGWAEVDSLCTSRYTDTEILGQWNSWKPLLNKFAKSRKIEKRRASLVLLCSPLRKISDERLAQMAIQNIIRLSSEKEILITKAISWTLRNMIKFYRPLVEEYIKSHSEELPKIALRETRIKLATGKKSKNQVA